MCRADCVDGVCRCGSVPRLPKPQELSASFIRPMSNMPDDVSYLITWTYPENVSAAEVLAVRIERAEKVMGVSSIYRKIREFHHKAELAGVDRNHKYQQPIHLLEPYSSYRVRVAAQDAHHCEGYVAELYLNSKSIALFFFFPVY